jgi:hypothetical protein
MIFIEEYTKYWFPLHNYNTKKEIEEEWIDGFINLIHIILSKSTFFSKYWGLCMITTIEAFSYDIKPLDGDLQVVRA